MAQRSLEEFCHWLFSQDCVFSRGINDLAALPPLALPEVAFVGRSNVGKSSLLNALLGRKNLARVSHTPGRTQQLNFFTLAQLLYIVDMPGYGYAAVSKAKLSLFSHLTQHYIHRSRALKRVFLLIDSRHGLKSSDLDFMKMLDTEAVSYQIVLTKLDKCSSAHLEKISLEITETLKKHPAAFPSLLATSAAKKRGLSALRHEIAALVFPLSESS